MKDEILVTILLLILVSDVLCSLLITQKSATKLINETFFVLCRDEGGRPVVWKGPKGQLGIRTRPSVQTASYGTALLFNQTTTEDSGTYSCWAGDEKKEFHLTIETPLTFMDTSSNQTGIEGQDVNLRCEVRGGKVTWSIEGSDLIDKKYTIMGDGLLIKNLHRTDSKTYICKAVQPSTGVVVDRKIKLRVLHKPSFPHPVYAKQEQAYGYIDGVVNLTCIVVADPPPHFEWVKNHDRNEKIGRIINIPPDVSILQLHVDKSTFGNYKCIATNPYGKLEKHFSLDEGAKPDPPKFIELRGANADLLDLGIHSPEHGGGVVLRGMETTGFSVLYRPTTLTGWRQQNFNITEENSYPLQDLHPDTEYEIKAATRNAAGLSDYTNSSIFRTLTSKADCIHSLYYSNLTIIIFVFFFSNIMYWS